MHKDSKENEKERVDKVSKKKDTSSRRNSAIHLAPPARGAGERPPSRKKDVEDSPDVKTVTRHSRRQAALRKLTAADEQAIAAAASDSTSPPKASISARSGSVRQRGSISNSGLPKYRPRSMLGEAAVVAAPKAPSPTHHSRRRRLSSSDDETDEVKTPKELSPLDSSAQARKSTRSISPLPHRAALKVNLTSAINVRPATPEKKEKGTPQPKGSPSSGRISSVKASKTSKTSTPPPSNASSARSALPRPPSSASSSASAGSLRVAGTPPTPTMTGSLMKGSNSLRLNNVSGGSSPLRTVVPGPPESPLGRVSARKHGHIIHVRGASVPPEVPSTPTPKIVKDGDNNDDSIDAEDVEFMLGSSVSPTAPTPAVPRMRRNAIEVNEPHTPSRSPFLPSRANLSYASPTAPSSSESSPFLRPKGRLPGNDRGSILSWEQLAKHSKSLDDEDVERMISEMPAPFRAGAISPALSTIDIPESPSLSALPSPTGYGSISQVLLPDVTPSPAVHNTTRLFDNMKSDTPSTDGAATTLLRLQLAAAESRSQERLKQMQELEAQLHAAKEARRRDADELARQISALEQQVHGNLLVESQRVEQIAVLEEMLHDAQSAQDLSARAAQRRAEDALAACRVASLQARQVQARADLALAAREAGAAWVTVSHTAESERELVRANRDMLSLLLAGLDHTLAQLGRV